MNNQITWFMVQSILAAVTCLAAAVFDIKTNKIPNKLTFPMIIVGLVLSLIFAPIKETIISSVIVVALFFLGMTNLIGLGDIKLLMAVTMIGGWKMGVFSFIIATIYLCICAYIINPIETGFYITKTIKRLHFQKQKFNKNSTKYTFAPFMFLGVLTFILFLDENSPIYIIPFIL